jgi:hypothetical protein
VKSGSASTDDQTIFAYVSELAMWNSLTQWSTTQCGFS